MLILILASVLLHELGHALAARKLGIPILDIMLTPICGLARLKRAPDRPRDELLVAFAGPLTNGLIALVFAVFLWVNGVEFSMRAEDIHGNLLLTIFWINTSLFVLNLLPVFPMDGGRVLRALLSMFVDKGKATLVSARLGQLLSLVACITGVVTGVFPLIIIGIFLLVMAEQEIRLHRMSPDID